MPNPTAAERVIEYDRQGHTSAGGELYNDILRKLLFYDKSFYHQYLPTLDSGEFDFQTRLDHWLSNPSTDAEKRVLLEAAADITFFSREDILKLHQAALNGPISRWIIGLLNLSLEDNSLEATLDNEISNHTWFCAVTDSMRISDFYHANKLGGMNLRPDAKSLTKFGDRARILHFIQTHTSANNTARPIRRIVLLEDFVGSGTQLREPERTEAGPTGPTHFDVVSFVASLDSNIPVLLCPLITCPPGHTYAQTLLSRWSNLTYEPVLRLSEDEFVNSRSAFPSGSLNDSIKQIATSTYSSVVGNDARRPLPYSAYGAFDVGANVVMYSNTPANTLPFIQHKSNTWSPLFPRSARIR